MHSPARPGSESPRKSGKQARLLGCCVGLPLLLMALLASLYWYNNRSLPPIAIPTPQIPNPNAYDDFVRAGTLARGMQHKSPFSLPKPTYTFTEFRAAAKDAEPVLAAIRQGLNKEYLFPPVRGDISSSPLITF